MLVYPSLRLDYCIAKLAYSIIATSFNYQIMASLQMYFSQDVTFLVNFGNREYCQLFKIKHYHFKSSLTLHLEAQIFDLN